MYSPFPSHVLNLHQSGVGKSSLINTAFGINEAVSKALSHLFGCLSLTNFPQCSADLKRGIADIQEGLESPVNKRFILHDSLGFEPGEKNNYITVKEFIRSRQTGALKDQLHAVW
jgi:predicted GTPase